MIDTSKITVLETTLRDGSYVIDFQFTARDTEVLCRALAASGIDMIEVGHGLGINAGADYGYAAATDVEYIQAARRGAGNAPVGMFCIPGLATLDHLRTCVDAGLQFVRIGVNVDQYKTSESFVAEARRLGLLVCTNFMKSYVMKPQDFAKIVKVSADYGSHAVYLVDSAGGMVPDEVERYIYAMREVTDLPLGFHGHNNLQLAVGNSLIAVKAGATLIDTTLLGMGRSSGNAPTEIIVPLLQKHYDSCKSMDTQLLLELAEEVISPLIKNRWEDTDKTALGIAQVHSMYMEKIRTRAKEEKKLLYSLIFEVGERDCLNLSQEVLDEAVSAAEPDDRMKTLLGDVSLVESLDGDCSVDRILRVAVKLNLSLIIFTCQGPTSASVNKDHGTIKVTCSGETANSIVQRAKDRILHIEFQTNSSNNLNVKHQA